MGASTRSERPSPARPTTPTQRRGCSRRQPFGFGHRHRGIDDWRPCGARVRRRQAGHRGALVREINATIDLRRRDARAVDVLGDTRAGVRVRANFAGLGAGREVCLSHGCRACERVRRRRGTSRRRVAAERCSELILAGEVAAGALTSRLTKRDAARVLRVANEALDVACFAHGACDRGRADRVVLRLSALRAKLVDCCDLRGRLSAPGATRR